MDQDEQIEAEDITLPDDVAITEPDEDPESLEHRKLFVGDLNSRVTEENLIHYFNQFGQVEQAVVLKDPRTGISRGFGFVVLSESVMVDRIQDARPHHLMRNRIETRRATVQKEGSSANDRKISRKLFVGGVRHLEQKDIFDYFKTFGSITSVSFVKNRDTQKKRGFAFVEFTDYDPVDKIMLSRNHVINGYKIDVSKARPKVVEVTVRVPRPPKSKRVGRPQ